MVTEYGMSERLGPLTFGTRKSWSSSAARSREQRNYSEEVAEEIDEEVRGIIDQAYELAHDVLTTNRERLDRLAAKLVAEETVDSADFEALFADLPPKTDVRTHGSIVAPGDNGPALEPAPNPI